MGYLLDTNICIYFLKNLYDISTKISEVNPSNCYISEISIAELKFGAENSNKPIENHAKIKLLQETFTIVPIFLSLDIYAKEKARLKKIRKPLDDFDLLIGATAISNNLVLVTKNISDFERLEGIMIEDWSVKNQA